VIGGQIEPGSTVGVVMSFDPFELATSGAPIADPESPDAALPTRTPNTTKLTLNSILVTSLQLSQNDAERTTETQTDSDDDGDQPVIAADINEAPDDQLLVTLAVSAPEVEQIVFAAEFGRIWLTAQNADTDNTGSRILTLDQVYVEVPR
jgi:pilus assembly protein CpaB